MIHVVRFEIREPGATPRIVSVTATTDVGRDCDGVVIADTTASRRHLQIVVGDDVRVVDVGSTNGTFVNEQRIDRDVVLRSGDVVRLGSTELLVRTIGADTPSSPPSLIGSETTQFEPLTPAFDASRRAAPTAPPHVGGPSTPPPPPPPLGGPTTQPPPPPPLGSPVVSGRPIPTEAPPLADRTLVAPAPTGPSVSIPSSSGPDVAGPPPIDSPPAPPVEPRTARPGPPATRPALDQLALRATEVADIRYRPGSAGERAAAAVAAQAKRARARLAGFGSEGWGIRPTICLVDPFPDPDRPGEMVTGGTIVDAERGEIWMVVTAEAPPEAAGAPDGAAVRRRSPRRPPSSAGCSRATGSTSPSTPDPDPAAPRPGAPPARRLRRGELGAAMALSFVRSLLARAGRRRPDPVPGLRAAGRASTPPRRRSTASRSPSLEEAWRQKLARGPAEREDRPLPAARRCATCVPTGGARPRCSSTCSSASGSRWCSRSRSDVCSTRPSRAASSPRSPSCSASSAIAFVVSLLADLRRAYLAAYVSGAVVRSDPHGDVRQAADPGRRLVRPPPAGRRAVERLFSDVGLRRAGARRGRCAKGCSRCCRSSCRSSCSYAQPAARR